MSKWTEPTGYPMKRMKQNLPHHDLYLRHEKEEPKSCQRGKKPRTKGIDGKTELNFEKPNWILEDSGTKSEENKILKSVKSSEKVKYKVPTCKPREWSA